VILIVVFSLIVRFSHITDRNVVEYAYDASGGRIRAGQELIDFRRSISGGGDAARTPDGTSLNNTQGSEEGAGLDLPEEDQAEAHIVRNQLTV
jgi:hypothetical protein